MAKSNWDFMSSNYIPIYLFIGVIGFTLLSNIIYYHFTKFTKTITIKSKYTSMKTGKYGGTRYMIEDSDTNLYKVINVSWKFEFDEAEDWNRLEVGKTYKVNGYGKRISFMGLYPGIYSYSQ